MNKSKEIKIEKITLNVGAGTSPESVNKGFKLLESLSGAKPVRTITKKRIPTWGVRPGLAIGCKVTLRGNKAEELLRRLLKSKKDTLFIKNFDDYGNLSFGIKEYLDIPGAKYDAEIGIRGLETAITLQRAGFRIKRRRLQKKSIGKKHKITPVEAMEFIKTKFGVEIAT